MELDATILEEPDLSATLGLDDTGISFVASSSGTRGRQAGLVDLDATLPSEMPGPLMASSPVRLRAETAEMDTSGIAVVASTDAPDASDAPDAPVSVVSVADVSVADVTQQDVTQPTSTTAEVQAENGKS